MDSYFAKTFRIPKLTQWQWDLFDKERPHCQDSEAIQLLLSQAVLLEPEYLGPQSPMMYFERLIYHSPQQLLHQLDYVDHLEGNEAGEIFSSISHHHHIAHNLVIMVLKKKKNNFTNFFIHSCVNINLNGTAGQSVCIDIGGEKGCTGRLHLLQLWLDLLLDVHRGNVLPASWDDDLLDPSHLGVISIFLNTNCCQCHCTLLLTSTSLSWVTLYWNT